ncbi:MAG: tubulin/FtsZ GTPase [Methanohalophilus sp.]|nr:MAG: tubulin/FtsZ GTPase [Methanohalophilus sp.]
MLNILMVGNGQCGNRILDSINRQAFGSKSRFAKFYAKQQYKSNVQTLAINTAVNDLKEMKYTKAKDRIHIPHLHGVGANRNVGRKVFDENKSQIMRNLDERGSFDIAFVITSASGGTGSSFTPSLIRELKEQNDYPVYAVVVLPFREEGTLYLQNAAFALRDIRGSGVDGIILADNQYLKQMGGDVESAYDSINEMIAKRLLFLLDSLDSEMMMVTDLGDFKTVMSGGAGIATIGYYEADGEVPIRTAIQKAGIIVRKGEYPRVLSVLTLESASELEELYHLAVGAINTEKEKKERVQEDKEVDKAFSQIEGLEPQY